MKDGQGDFGGRFFLGGMHAGGNPSSIIRYHDTAIHLEHDLNFISIPGHVFIHTIINNLIHHMMQTIDPRAADIHGRSFLNRFQSFKDTDLIGIVPSIRMLAVCRGGRFLARVFWGFHTILGFNCVWKKKCLLGQIRQTFTGITTALNVGLPCS